MKNIVTAEEFNKSRAATGIRFVIRFAFGSWVVCDGLAPNGWVGDSNAAHIGYVVKWCDSYAQAEEICAMLNN